MTDEGRDGRGPRRTRAATDVGSVGVGSGGGGRGGEKEAKTHFPPVRAPSPLSPTMSWQSHGGRRGNAVLRHIELSFAEGVVDLDEDGEEEEDNSDAFVSAARPPAFAAHALQWDDGCILKVRRNGGG
jgi:hypothetical protein